MVLALAGCPSKAPQAGKPKPKHDPSAEPSKPMTEDPPPKLDAIRKRPDPHSYSRPDQVEVKHLGLSWVVDFDARTLTGDALLLLERHDPKAPLILDGRGLDIKSVSAAKLELTPGEHGVPELAPAKVRESSAFTETKWRYDDPDPGGPDLGKPIVVELPAEANVVKLTYATKPGATGLQWLDPEQTAGKQHPFLYSQSQAIHARSWIPSQDSPGVRTTWDAEVIVDGPLTAVMAAEQLGEVPPGEGGKAKGDDSHRFRFVMPQKVPAYLIAIAVGDLERKQVGERTAVWADPGVVEAAADEFADMEQMLESAEELYGDYAWGRYDVLVLPPAFPFGGMENPRLTFATPTILAGDRSLVSLIAHELAHSWSGNLVTNSTWGDMWLNEGFTVYFERRIVEAIYGREQAEIEAVIGKQELLAELEDPAELGDKPEFQRLDVDIAGHDPDDNFSAVPYEKGALFLRTLEESYGREVFDAFLRKWFDAHAFGSVNTEEFLSFAREHLLAAHEPLPGESTVDLDTWVKGTTIPEGAAEPEAEVLDDVEDEARHFAAGEIAAKEIEAKGWSPWLWLHFLRSLPEDLSAAQMGELDEAHELTASQNAEILGQWLELAAKHRYEPAYERMESFLIRVGRRKFLTPIYRALAETEEGKAQARKIYEKARPGYHSISRGTIDKLLEVY